MHIFAFVHVSLAVQIELRHFAHSFVWSNIISINCREINGHKIRSKFQNKYGTHTHTSSIRSTIHAAIVTVAAVVVVVTASAAAAIAKEIKLKKKRPKREMKMPSCHNAFGFCWRNADETFSEQKQIF